MPDYQVLKNAYFGTGGFATGTYLQKHKRETEEDYRIRRRNAYYLNYFAPIVNALVDPIFKRRPLRDYEGSGSTLVKEFSKDVDTTGMDIHSFMKRAAVMAKVYGVSFIVVDNNTNPAERADSLEAMKEKRQFPYAYLLMPEDVEEYGIDKTGQLTYIKFHEIASIVDGSIQYRYTYFDRNGWRVWGDTRSGIEKSEGTYDLGCVPVIPLFSRLLEQKTILPEPELLPIARTAQALYNHCSWLSEILRNQTFPLLTIPSLDLRDITIGTNNALGYDPQASHAPDFIAPSSDPATILQTQITNLIQEMYRMASLSFVLNTQNSSSGIARQWEFERTNQQLANFAMQCKRAEENMMQLFTKWTHYDLSYTVSYPDDFGIVDVTEQLTQAQSVLDMNLTDELKVDVLKKVLAAYVPDMPDERVDELVASAEKTKDDEIHANPVQTPIEEDDDTGDE